MSTLSHATVPPLSAKNLRLYAGHVLCRSAYDPREFDKKTLGKGFMKRVHLGGGFKFQRFFIFTPILGDIIQFDSYFWDGLVQPPKSHAEKFNTMKMLATPHPGKKVANDHSKTSSGSVTPLLKLQNEQ